MLVNWHTRKTAVSVRRVCSLQCVPFQTLLGLREDMGGYHFCARSLRARPQQSDRCVRAGSSIPLRKEPVSFSSCFTVPLFVRQ